MITAAEELGSGLLSEQRLREAVDLLVRLVEAAGALIIFVGAVLAFVGLLRAAARPRRDRDFTGVRLGLGRYLLLGLEFQLASDILSTAIAPTFDEIGQLAAIAAIRTVLNYVLGRELTQERREVRPASSDTSGARPSSPVSP